MSVFTSSSCLFDIQLTVFLLSGISEFVLEVCGLGVGSYFKISLGSVWPSNWVVLSEFISEVCNLPIGWYFLICRPVGRQPGRPLKRLPDGYSREAETGHLLATLRDQKKWSSVRWTC